jgi:hypothetical protein
MNTGLQDPSCIPNNKLRPAFPDVFRHKATSLKDTPLYMQQKYRCACIKTIVEESLWVFRLSYWTGNFKI